MLARLPQQAADLGEIPKAGGFAAQIPRHGQAHEALGFQRGECFMGKARFLVDIAAILRGNGGDPLGALEQGGGEHGLRPPPGGAPVRSGTTRSRRSTRRTCD